ncbi:hypothetical protein ACFVT1_35265 [Streptomyces sp. NPDC057963]|uniref:hypothetical protein n=1 Tax=Streptomyces sp. NPDC057963 TaxID=3346290 RepID=UPI0036E5A95C
MSAAKRWSRTGLLATAVAATLTVTVTGAATAAAGPVSDARFLAHLNMTDGQRPENIALEPGGSADVTFELRPTGFLGANGIKIYNGTAWVSNLDKGTVLRIPLTCHGSAGPVETRATGLVDIDDFDFTGAGDTLLAAINKGNEVVLVRPGGSHSIVLTAADGLQNPTSLAVRGGTVYIAGGAYFTNSDPNVLAAHIEHGKWRKEPM